MYSGLCCEDSFARRGGPPAGVQALAGAGGVHALLHAGATHGDMLRAYLHAHLLADPRVSGRRGAADVERFMRAEYEPFLEALRGAGWRTEHVLLAPGSWRLTFTARA